MEVLASIYMSPFHFPSFFSMASIVASPVKMLCLPCLHAQWLSCVCFVTPWTVAHQAPLSMGFPRQEREKLLFPVARLERVASSFSRGSSQPRDQTHISCLASGSLSLSHLGRPPTIIKIGKTSLAHQQYADGRHS